jgi:hypothetical protein
MREAAVTGLGAHAVRRLEANGQKPASAFVAFQPPCGGRRVARRRRCGFGGDFHDTTAADRMNEFLDPNRFDIQNIVPVITGR